MGMRDQKERLATGRVKFHKSRCLYSRISWIYRFLSKSLDSFLEVCVSVTACLILIPRSSRDTSPSSDSEEWVIVQNGEAGSTDSPSRSPGDSDASLHLRPARPPNPTSHRQTASPSKKSSYFISSMPETLFQCIATLVKFIQHSRL